MVDTFVGALCGPRPRRNTGGPSISSDHGGLSGSAGLREIFFGGLKVVASFILFSLSQRDDVWRVATLGVYQHDHGTLPESKRHQPLFTVSLALVFASNRKIIPNRITSNKVEAVVLDVGLPFASSNVTIAYCSNGRPWYPAFCYYE